MAAIRYAARRLGGCQRPPSIFSTVGAAAREEQRRLLPRFTPGAGSPPTNPSYSCRRHLSSSGTAQSPSNNAKDKTRKGPARSERKNSDDKGTAEGITSVKESLSNAVGHKVDAGKGEKKDSESEKVTNQGEGPCCQKLVERLCQIELKKRELFDMLVQVDCRYPFHFKIARDHRKLIYALFGHVDANPDDSLWSMYQRKKRLNASLRIGVPILCAIGFLAYHENEKSRKEE